MVTVKESDMQAQTNQPEPETQSSFSLSLEQVEGYRFNVHFDRPSIPDLIVDESPPIGEAAGPTPVRMLASAIGHCLASSLLFCLEKARVEVHSLSASVSGTVARNEAGRLRVSRIDVVLEPEIAPADEARLQRCAGIFEDYCTVTGSVRPGIDVRVDVRPVTYEPTATG